MNEIELLRQRVGDLERENALLKQASGFEQKKNPQVESWLIDETLAKSCSKDNLQDSIELNQTILDNVHVGMVVCSPSGNITYANPALCRLVGVEKSGDVIGTNVIQYYAESDRVRVQEKILPHVIAHGHQEIEIPICSIQGKLTPTIQSFFVIRDRLGRPVLLANALTDITEQKKLENELRQHRDHLEKLVAERTEHLLEFNRELCLSEEHYRLLVENIPLRIFIKDKDSTYVSCNSLFAQDLGISNPDQIVGHRDEEFFDQAYVEMTLAEDQLVLERGETIETEHTYPIKSGMLTVRMLKTPMRDESGEGVGVLGMFQDITAQRQLKNQLQQAQKMDAIGQLAGGIAHDFNNLLVGILGAADMLACELRHNSVMMSYVRLITEASSRAAELIKQLLAFSRKSHNQNIQVDLHEIIENSISILERTIDRRVSINRKLKAEMFSVKGDPARLESMILNLGVNARDAMPEGGEFLIQTRNVGLSPEICRERELDQDVEEFIEILVKDRGCGMEDDTLVHIFEPFFTTKGEGKGTGLGLAAVYGTVKDHRGHIEVKSEKEQGTRFVIYLPIDDTTEENSVCDTDEVESQSGHVLVIDDDNIALTGAKTVLESLGYRVTVATDGIAGIHAYKELQEEIDLVLLDLVMPRMNGEDVFSELKKIDPNLKVVISSGYSRNLVIDRILDAGAMRFLQKPYRARELARIVYELTNNSDCSAR